MGTSVVVVFFCLLFVAVRANLLKKPLGKYELTGK